MGNLDNSESRMEAALLRLEKAAASISTEHLRGNLSADTDELAAENAALKRELETLTKKYESLKQKTEMVSGRLDHSIEQLSMILEQ